jgi:tetratricopeptide (TPR) repeat protein
MNNSKFQQLRTQFIVMWKQLQPGSSAREMSIDTPAENGEVVNGSLVKIREIPGKDLFTDTTATLSKLNLPKVNVDPWSAFWAILIATIGGTGVSSYLLLIAVPPTPDCRGIGAIASDNERLYCAQVGADTHELPKLIAAVNLVKGWTDSQPLYSESQRLLKNWSEDLFKIATKQLNGGDMEKAISTLKIIPPNSPNYAKTQALLAKWSAQSQDSGSIDLKFDAAMKLGDWNAAFGMLQQVQRMKGIYWNTHKHQQMSVKLVREQDGWDKLQTAKNALEGKENNGYTIGAKRPDLATKKDPKVAEVPLPTQPEPIVKAMEIANQIDPKTYVYQQGQELRNAWSKQLVHLAIEKYKAQSFNEATEIAGKVPSDVSVYPEAQDWVKLNQATVAGGKQNLFSLVDAIAQVKKIPKTSSIYPIAHSKQANWQVLLHQQTQLQWAKTLGQFQQPALLGIAIDTAKQIPATSAAGKAIQPEIANWHRQIQTVDNRATLAKAQHLVATGTSLANLKTAVSLAGKITKDLPMGEEATAAVSEWNVRIQTIEDRPILDNALAVAQRGNLTQAIAVADRIAPGRALYPTAQASVRQWYRDLQDINDRQTLNRAIATYRRGNISEAIQVAGTIGRRSSSYGDAHGYMSEWRALLVPKVAPKVAPKPVFQPRVPVGSWFNNNNDDRNDENNNDENNDRNE